MPSNGSGEADESLWSCPTGSEADSNAPEEQQQMGKKGKNVLARAIGKFCTKHQEIYVFNKNWIRSRRKQQQIDRAWGREQRALKQE